MERLKNNNILQAWLVLTLAVCFGAALAGVQLWLGPKIEANKVNETLEKVPELVLGASLAAKMTAQNQHLDVEPLTIAVDKGGKKVLYSVYKAAYGGDLRGWVAKAAGQGYADKIELLLGLDPQAQKLTGLFVLDQKETPGLGNKIVTDKWRGQFIARSTAKPFTVVKDGADRPEEIDAVTGATISSRSVSNIINSAVGDLRDSLVAKAAAAGKKEN